jgi:Flp pilus assembly protein TadG
VELAIHMPIAILLVMASLQTGLYFHGRSVAQAAAQEGCRVAAALDGTAEAGHQAAQEFAEQMGAGELEEPQVVVDRAENTARVTVSGTGMSLVPMWHPNIKRTSTCPVERVTW